MLDYHMYLMRYGEHSVQAIIENIERNEGIHNDEAAPLEKRWNRVMKDAASVKQNIAA